MESLHAFIPIDRRHALARNEDLPDRTYGAALFADISGFTPLTAALAQELGVQRGAEEVLNQINPVFDALITELHRFGGSVMGFAGDSITCWLNGDNGHSATACALAMQQAMTQFATVRTPAGTPITLAIKVAVTVGPARRFAVGDPAVQLIDVLAGETLDHMAKAEKLAEKGEIVVGEEVIAVTADAVIVREWRQDSESGYRFAVVEGLRREAEAKPIPPLPPGALTDEQARPWVLPPVYERVKSGERFLAELRPTVALFLRFTGIQYDSDDDAGRKLDAYIRWLQGVLRRHEGFLIQLTMGDKGSYLYASFGAPLAHDDDPDRALAAALELRAPPPELAYIQDIQIGISRGRVWAGQCGARERNTYGVMGNEVNMAARLMGKARPGQILVRQRVADATSRRYQYRSMGLITVKGGAEPIPVAELLGRREAQEWQAVQFDFPLLGRETELAQLERMLDGVLAGHGQLAALIGMAGIGKSHLATVFQSRAAANGFQVAAGISQRAAEATAYAPWRQVLERLLLIPSPANADETTETLSRRQIEVLSRTLLTVNPAWEVRLPLLGDLLGLPIPDNPTTAAFEPKARQEALFALVVEILRAWATAQPLLLVIDNAHWLDEASRALTESLAKAMVDIPMMLLFVSRRAADAETDFLGSLSRFRYYRSMNLRELPSESIGEQVALILGGKPSLLARVIIEAKANGNPFFTRELVDTLREAGQLVQHEDEWVLSPSMVEALRAANCLVQESGLWVLAESADLSAVSLGIPDSIHGIILARIDRIPETQKPTLKVASVIGYTFELGLVAQVHPAHPSSGTLREHARTLEERDFILPDPAAKAAATFTFRQQTTQEVAYETLLYTQRRELHRNLAEIMAVNAPDAVDQIAYHAFLGEDWPRAMEFQLLAGHRAKQLFANLQSIDHFRKALQSAQNLPPEETQRARLEALLNLGELLLTTGQYDAAREHLRQALEIAETIGDVDGQANICRWYARSFEVRGQYEPALEWVTRGLAAQGDRLSPVSLELRLIAGLIYSRQGEYGKAREQGLACMLAAEEMKETAVLARAHNLLGIIARLRGKTGQAIEYFEQMLALFRASDNLQGQALAQNQLGNIYFDTGNWTDADNYYRQAGQTFSQIGDVYRRLLVDNNLGGIALNQGRLDEALQFYAQALRAQEQIGGSLWVMGALHLNLGTVHIRRGELGAAFDHLHTGRRLFEEAKVRDLLPEMHRHLAEAYLAKGNLDEAEAEAQHAVALSGELSMPGEQGHARRVLGDIVAARGRYADAEQELRQALALLQEVGDEYGLARTQLSLAALFQRGERRQEMHDQLAACTPVLERLGAMLELTAAQELSKS